MLREQFPILHTLVNGRPLVYLDSAATAQRPLAVIEAMDYLHRHINGNIHRGVHYMAEQTTALYEQAREQVRAYIHAAHGHEVIFTAGTTAAINLVAHSFGLRYMAPGDEVIVSEMEHHSNIVPWQLMCQHRGATLKVLPFDDQGLLRVDLLPSLITPRTRLLAVTQASNVLGTINPIKEIVALAHAHGVAVLVDGAQGILHQATDVQELDCDFYAFSGHKLYGPTGIGVLYAKERWLHEMPPYQGGGDMVKTVSMAHTTYADLPFKFEAGTANYVAAVGLGAAIQFLEGVGHDALQAHEGHLLRYATQRLQEIEGLRIYGQAEHKTSTLSFTLQGIHPLDTGQILDKLGIAVRTGTLCAEPVMQHYGITGVVRASLALYNTTEEVDALVAGLERVKMMMG